MTPKRIKFCCWVFTAFVCTTAIGVLVWALIS
jgi:hypothetical protein